MYCKNCGNQIPDDASFCPACGATANAEEPVFEAAPAAEPVTEAQPAAQLGNTTTLLVLAIIGLALGASWLAVGGIVVSAIAKKKIEAYVNAGGLLVGKAKVANILSRIGLPVSIVMTVLCVLYIILVVVFALYAADSGDLSYSSNFYF